MINKLGLLIFILFGQHYAFFNIYNWGPDWKETTYMIITVIGGIMYLWEKEKK